MPSHGSEMEGWFWRLTDSASGRVVVAICSANQHPDGDWSTVAVGVHPGGILRTAALDGARAEQSRFALSAGTTPDAAAASVDGLRIDFDDVHLDLRFADESVDVLVVATTGGAGTEKLVGRAVLEALGPDGYLINIARGSVVDQDGKLERRSGIAVWRAGHLTAIVICDDTAESDQPSGDRRANTAKAQNADP